MLTQRPIVSSLKRAAWLGAMAAVAIMATPPAMAASSVAKGPTTVTTHAASRDVTDFSAQRRRYGGGGGYGEAAAAAAVAGIVGTAIIASQADRGYGYGYGSPYDSYAYSGGPVYDRGPGYYGPGYYGRSTGYFNGNGGVPLFKGRPLASW